MWATKRAKQLKAVRWLSGLGALAENGWGAVAEWVGCGGWRAVAEWVGCGGWGAVGGARWLSAGGALWLSGGGSQ